MLSSRSRWIAIAFLCAAFALPIAAQTPTVVSATIADPNGVPYSFAKISAQLLPTTATPTVIANGIPTQIGGQRNATADANGSFSMNLFCNTAGGGCSVISPSGTQWQVTVQTNGVAMPQGTGPQSLVQLFTITGATQTLTFTGVPALTVGGAGGGGITWLTVATLPVSPALNTTDGVTDGNGFSCTVGGGSTKVLCRWNGASWDVINQGSGAAPAFSAVTAGTNAFALVMGTGGSLSTSGSGTVAATSAPYTGLTSFPAACGSNLFITQVALTPVCTQPAFSNLSGVATKAQIPGTAVYTDQSNTFGAFTHDFSGAAHTLPQKTGLTANKPATCTVGETYFATDATAGQNLFYCTATNTFTQQLNSGGGTPGGSTDALQYNAGGGTFGGVNSPTANGDYGCVFHVTAAAAVPPTCPQVGQGGRAITGAATTDTVLFSDVLTPIHHDKAASGAVNQTLPTATTLGNANFAYSYCNHSAQTDTITPTTWTIQAGNVAAGASLSVASGTCYRIKVDPNSATNWLADVTGASGGTGDMLKNAANTMGASGTIDNSAETAANAFKVPVQAGAAPTANGAESYDSTANVPKVGVNGATYNALTTDPAHQIMESDNFCATDNANRIGTHLWIPNGPGSMSFATSGPNPGSTNYPCGVAARTGATSGNSENVNTNATQGTFTSGNFVGSNMEFDFQLEQHTAAPQQSLWIGWLSAGAAGNPSNFFGLRLVETTAGANFFFVCRSAGVDGTATDTTVAANTSIHKFKLQEIAANSYKMQLDGGTLTTINTGCPASFLGWFGMKVDTTEAVSKGLDLWYWQWDNQVAR